MATIFLDRDGVINENRSDYVKNWQEFRFLPGSREAIARLTQAGYRIIVCTNQAGVARGSIPASTVEDIHQRMADEIARAGGCIEKVYYCPHAKDAHCSCRKPMPGMVLRARDELGLDLSDAVFVGDSISDVRAGLAAGIHSVLVLTGLGVEQLRDHYHEANGPFLVTMNLKHAVESILQGLHVSESSQTAFKYSYASLFERAKYTDALGAVASL
ncbi:D-glycero-beta-D-manno-heptose 1,7-bisphosphate 7-phosphatase [Ktedonosporobacter rubrisoli]|uniref:D-glycero-beta-D-manno-heptose 1,7-bisphosphate 7-phosphatase n=1 Tax=Ktedonosporobacter rubrisoli TaxID=2509675 RepID=UPI0013EED965|nr:D-glycero-beta-D-manno-heptose 1,7-bisphosphate 7-phosphatase [Ktedonosporobacter rubrisoli]